MILNKQNNMNTIHNAIIIYNNTNNNITIKYY